MVPGPDQFVLAIDLGTSGPKVAAVTLDGRVLGWAFEPTRLDILPDGGAEQDPHDWWRAISSASRRALADLDAGRCVAVACTAQWSGTVPIDGEGHPIGKAIIWMDSRGSELIAERIGGPVRVEGYDVRKAARWIRLTGGAPGKSGKDSIAHILWIKEHQPDRYAATQVFLEPKDYLNLRMTGVRAAGFDSMALHWVTDNRDIDAVAYDDGLLELGGLERYKLPDLRRPTDVLGELLPGAAGDLGVAPGLPVVMGTPDLHSAAIGSGGVIENDAHLYLGTSSWLICHVPYKKTDLIHNIASLPSALPGRWMVADEQETAGACLNFLADNLALFRDGPGDNVYQRFDRVAEAVPPGSNGLMFTPWLFGERTPVEDAYVRSGFFNQSLATTREDMVRAVFEGVALNSRWLLKYVEKFTGTRIDGIRMVGGGANSEVWCRIHADVLGRTVHRMADPILVNAKGAALLAGVSLGWLTVEDIPDRVEIAETHGPDGATAALYDERFDVFVDIYKANKGIHRRLNRRSDHGS